MLSSLCLEVASGSLEEYERFMGKLASLLATGGHLILVGVLAENYYISGGKSFYCLKISGEQVKEAMKKQGLEIVRWLEQQHPGREQFEYSDCEACFVALAHKKPDS